MNSSLQEIRDSLSMLYRPHANTPYPESFKRLVVSYGHERLSSGQPFRALVLELGICGATLRTWLASVGDKASPVFTGCDADPIFLPVKVSSSAESSKSLVLVTPGGYRVEGLDTCIALDLLARLP